MAVEAIVSTDKWMNFLTEAANLEVDDESLAPGVLLSPPPPQLGLEQGVCSVGGIPSTEECEKAGSSTRKRARDDCAAASEGCSKANREKMRRDRLNDRFVDLSRSLEPGKAPKSDKASILCDAVRVLNQLRAEAQALKDTNGQLLDQIKELKAEKHELREEKARLKAENERLGQQVKSVPMAVPAPAPPAPAYNPHAAAMQAAAAAYAAQMHHQMAMGPKAVTGAPAPIATAIPAVAAIPAPQPQHHQQSLHHQQQQHQHQHQGYAMPAPAPMAMWQWMAATSADTSQDHVLRPPVA